MTWKEDARPSLLLRRARLFNACLGISIACSPRGHARQSQMLVELSISRDPSTTLQEQVATQIRVQILSGRLRPGDELPSSRDLANQYDLSRNTITHAYDRLLGEGYLETLKGVGTRVASLIPDACLVVVDKSVGGTGLGPAQRVPVVFRGETLKVPSRSLAPPAIDFWPGRPNRDHFPVTAWRRLADEVLATSSSGLIEYGDPAGLLALREAIAAHVSAGRGFDCTADMVIITAGIQEAINLIARMLVTDGTGVVMENPGYGSAARTFESYGARLFPVRVDEDGIDTDHLPQTDVSLAYVTPSHQFPTGAPMSADRRRALLEWSYRTGAYIVEDDYDSDFNYSGPPLLSLAGGDTANSIIYTGTFSKALGAGVRTGFIIVPPQLIDVARAIKTMSNYGHPWLDQAILVGFLRGDVFQRHLRLIRKAYSETLLHLTRHLTMQFGTIDLWGTHNGMHVMWRPPSWVGPAETFKLRLQERGVHVHTLRSGGAYDEASGYGEMAILLGYAALSHKEVQTAVAIMARVAEEKVA